MTIKVFKTFTSELDYFKINILPAISIKWTCGKQTIVFVGWLIWGLKWSTSK